MSHFTVREWGHVKLGEGGFARAQADALHAAACQHPLAHRDGTNMLIYRRDRIVARQMVGMVAAKGCSLEILPKVDPDAVDGERPMRSAIALCGCSMLRLASIWTWGARRRSRRSPTRCSKC